MFRGMCRYKTEFSLCLVKRHAVKAYGDWRRSSIYSSARYEMDVSGQIHVQTAFTSGANWIDG